jgi:hypothetical protein
MGAGVEVVCSTAFELAVGGNVAGDTGEGLDVNGAAVSTTVAVAGWVKVGCKTLSWVPVAVGVGFDPDPPVKAQLININAMLPITR